MNCMHIRCKRIYVPPNNWYFRRDSQTLYSHFEQSSYVMHVKTERNSTYSYSMLFWRNRKALVPPLMKYFMTGKIEDLLQNLNWVVSIILQCHDIINIIQFVQWTIKVAQTCVTIDRIILLRHCSWFFPPNRDNSKHAGFVSVSRDK